jgi:HD-GYP domain-containing protein (c-di-GMP phosphodiesterase class II)
MICGYIVVFQRDDSRLERMATTVNLANVLLSLSDAIDLASPTISQHQLRTTYIACEIGKQAGLPSPLLEKLFIAALFHDIGAITVEEKIALVEFENVGVVPHCLRGELLMQRIPLFSPVAGIVGTHHREWREWDRPITDPDVLLSQILCLSDHVARLIKPTAHVLHQTSIVSELISSWSGTIFNPEIAGQFLTLSKREEFWLNIVNPRLYSLLFHEGPLQHAEISFEDMEIVSLFFKDLIDLKSPFTATHSTGVSACADSLSEFMGASAEDRRKIRIAGNLHDLGKLVIPNSILDKEGSLTDEEYQIIKSHTYYSYTILNSIANFHDVAQWGGYHHEKLDGSGYPFHYSGEALPVQARILTIADIFTALAEDRPYRKGMDRAEVLKVMGDMAARGKIDADIMTRLAYSYDKIEDRLIGAQAKARNFYNREFAIIQ